MTTTITLSPELEKVLAARVTAGVFASIEEAVHQIVEEALFSQEMEGDDLAWLKPLIAEADASLKRGEGMTLEESRRRRRAHLEALERGRC